MNFIFFVQNKYNFFTFTLRCLTALILNKAFLITIAVSIDLFSVLVCLFVQRNILTTKLNSSPHIQFPHFKCSDCYFMYSNTMFLRISSSHLQTVFTSFIFKSRPKKCYFHSLLDFF